MYARSMIVRILRLAARHPLGALAFVSALPVIAATLVAVLVHSAGKSEVADNPRAVLGRVWFDQFPEKTTDATQVWIWLGGGIGIHESGSFWRSAFDIFEFERQGDKLSMTYLQDKKTAETRFKLSRCDDKPPFDLCLDLTTALGGRTRYYGFSRGDDEAAQVPWSRSMLRSAMARAEGSRR
jgi:hypothetical protein